MFTAKQLSFQFVPSKELNVAVETKLLNLVTLAHNKMLLFQSQKERLALSKSKLVEVSLHSNPTTLTVLILLFWTTTMMILQPKVQEFFKLNLNQIHNKIVTKINHETKMMMANLAMFHKTLSQSKSTETKLRIIMKMAQMAFALEHEERKESQLLVPRKVSTTPLRKIILITNSREVSTMERKTLSTSQDTNKSLSRLSVVSILLPVCSSQLLMDKPTGPWT